MNAAPDTPANGVVSDVIGNHRRRAREARLVAYCYLAFSAVVLGAGVGAVWKSHNLVNYDVESVKSATPVADSEPVASHLRSVAANLGGRSFVAVGDDGVILTSDDGQNWKAAESGVREGLRSVVVAGGVAIAAGDDGIILRSRDGGQTWRTQRSNTPYDFNAVAASDETAIAVGDDGLLRVSHDRGRTWERPEKVVTGKDFNAVAVSDKTAVAAGDDGLLRVSSDGGKTWTAKDVDKTKNDFNAVAVSGEIAVAAGDGGLLRVSTDGGKNWTGKGAGSPERNRIRFEAVAVRGDAIVAVGRKRRQGVVWRFDASKVNDSGHPREVGDRLEAVALSADGKIAVAAARGGGILVSADGGQKWESRDSMTANDFNAVTLADDGLTAVAVGDSATISLLEFSAKGALSAVETKEGFVKAGAAPEKADTGSSPENAAASRRSDESSELTTAIFYHANMIRAGFLLLFMFFMRALFVMIRYHHRLAGFYDARADSVLLFGTEMLSQPDSLDDLSQPRRVGTLARLMFALSPDHLDAEPTPSTLADRMMAFFGRGSRKTNC